MNKTHQNFGFKMDKLPRVPLEHKRSISVPKKAENTNGLSKIDEV